MGRMQRPTLEHAARILTCWNDTQSEHHKGTHLVVTVSRSHQGSVSRVEEGFRCVGSDACSTSLIIKTHQVQRGKREASAEVNTGGWERESMQDERSQCFICQRMRRKVQTTRREHIIVPACINSNIGGKCTLCVPNVLLYNWNKFHSLIKAIQGGKDGKCFQQHFIIDSVFKENALKVAPPAC